MKKITLFFIFYLSCLILKAETTPATSYAGGSGTYADPYQIKTLAQLRRLSETTGDWGKSFVLLNDIDATDTKNWNSGAGFNPIGDSPTYGDREQIKYSGRFDGRGFTISNLYINRSTSNYVGLFGFATYQITRLNLKNADITGDERIGGILGASYNSSMAISQCSVSGTISGTSNVGGIAGMMYDGLYYTLTITNCYSAASVSGTSSVGGLVGATGNLKITTCHSYGSVSGTTNVGGLTGNASSGTSYTNNYFDSQASGQSSSPGLGSGVTALTTAQYAQETNFDGFFINTSPWYMSTATNPRPIFKSEQGTYTVTFNKGTGTLDGVSPQSVNYGLEALAVTITPPSYYNFIEWQDSAGNQYSTQSTLTATNVTDNITLTAIYEIYNYTVSFTTNTEGTLTGEVTQTVDHGSDASAVTAVPKNGYVFLEWQDGDGNLISTNNPLTLTNIISDTLVKAVYKIDGFDVTFTTDGNGSISGAALQTIPDGDNAQPVTAVPNTGYVFKEWKDASNNTFSTDNPLTITNVTEELTFTAIFELDIYTVTFSTSDGGTLTGSANQTVTHGTDATALTAVPSTGYTFKRWVKPDGTVLSSANPFTLENVTSDMNIEAVFSKTLDNITWTKANSPYIIKSDILIPNGATLTIEPGVEVLLAGKYIIRCEGTILSKGTAQDTIVFTVQDITNVWKGIEIESASTNDSSIFSYTKVEYSYECGLYVNNTHKVRVSNCVLKNNKGTQGAGIYLNNSNAVLINNTFQNNSASSSGGGVYCNNSDIKVIGNLFINNYGVVAGGGLYVYSATVYVINNTFANNSTNQYGGGGELNEYSTGYFYNNVYWGNNSKMSRGHNWYYWSSDGYYYNEAIEGGNASSSIYLTGTPLGSTATYSGGSFDATCINLSATNTDISGPNFVNPNNDIYTFTDASPLKNKGTVTSISGYLPSKDLFGNTRIQESVIDIGASEYTTYTLTLTSTTGGSISGTTSQVLAHGASSSPVELVPNEGYYFAEWQDASGNLLSTNEDYICEYITKNITITAVFREIVYFSVAFSTTEGGSITGTTNQTVEAKKDASEVTAAPNDGFEFIEWRNLAGDSITNINPLTITDVIQDSSLVAVFDFIHYTASISAGENGSITPSGDSIITVYDTIHCVITPDTDYMLESLTYNEELVVEDLIDNNDGSYSYDIISVNENVTIEVTFKEYVEYSITSSAGAHGSISPEGVTTVTSGFKTYEFTPDQGYIVSKVLVDDIAVPFISNSYTFNNIAANHTLYVEFKEFKGVLSLYPEKDAYLNYKTGSSYEDRANTNYGSNKNLNLLDSEWSARDYQQIVMHFSKIQEVLNSLNISAIEDTIESITLNLYHYPLSESPMEGNNSFNVYWYNKDWEETTITWNNAPAIDAGASYLGVSSSISAIQDYSIDITEMFLSNYEETGGEAGFRLKLNQGTSGSRQQAYFASKEYDDIAYAPCLKINVKGYEPTAVNTLTSNELQIHPNPTKGLVNISLENGIESAVLSVYSITGELVYSTPVFKGEPVDLSVLKEGMYIVKLNSEGHIYQTKLIKQ